LEVGEVSDPERMVERAIDSAFQGYVAQLFSVLVTAPDPEAALGRFMVGFKKGVAAHKAVLAELEDFEK
jgi:hypothetical protein